MGTTRETGLERAIGAGALLVGLLAGSAAGQATSLASVDVNGEQTEKDSFGGTISLDGRYVGFFCYDNLVDVGEGLLGTNSHVYVRDRLTGAIERLSVNSNEVAGNDYSYGPALSADLRFAAFTSYATNLVPGDTNGPYPDGRDVFVRDRQTGTTERISVDSLEVQANDGESYSPSISADGRYVAFRAVATNLVPGDTNAAADVFVRDRQLGTTERVSVDSLGGQGNGASDVPSMSADGRYVAFFSSATNLVAGDTNGVIDIFVRDRQAGTTVRVNVDSGGAQADGDSYSAVLSGDGRYVAFGSIATNLVAGDTNAAVDVFVRDLPSGTTERVSVDSSGAQGNAASTAGLISADGRFVVFESGASNLVAGDTNTKHDTFVRDRQSGTTERVSVTSTGAEGHNNSNTGGISSDGRYVAFASAANLAETDTNTWYDVYVRDRHYTAMESLCDPGSGSVIACPCANPPSGSGRGCENSASTGGAILAASGVAYLSQDTLVFTTSAERPTATSIVLQGNALLASGVVHGQGVRCAGGTIKRMYTKIASGGSITAPDFGAGDPSVSTRSAALGNAIQPGQSRWYLVYYRDPIVLGGCPPVSTFNATQTGAVVWLP